MNRMENSAKYTASWTADTLGRFVAQAPPMGTGPALNRPFVVRSPQLELAEPEADRTFLSTLGRTVNLADARMALPKMIRSAARTIPVQTSRPLWQAPVALIVFALLITAEWILRKAYGML
jgi:hypothetical protein